MLQIKNGPMLAADDYFICHKENGQDELHATLPLDDPLYPRLAEEVCLTETSEQQEYRIVSVQTSSDGAHLRCLLNLQDWQKTCLIPYSNGGKGLAETLQAVCPAGWSLHFASQPAARRLLEMDGPTPLEVAMECQVRFGCAIRFVTGLKQATVLEPDREALSNAFFTEEVNLRALPSFRGSSEKLCTRLYPMGKKGLTIAEVNGGKAYVENFSYTNQIICGFWKDTRYEDATALREDAQARVNALAVPDRRWTLDIVDLYRLDGRQAFSAELFTVISVIDRLQRQTLRVQVVEDRVYPHHPEKNQLIVAPVTSRVQRSRDALPESLENANSAFYQKLRRD